jgi:hypothetical protein
MNPNPFRAATPTSSCSPHQSDPAADCLGGDALRSIRRDPLRVRAMNRTWGGPLRGPQAGRVGGGGARPGGRARRDAGTRHGTQARGTARAGVGTGGPRRHAARDTRRGGRHGAAGGPASKRPASSRTAGGRWRVGGGRRAAGGRAGGRRAAGGRAGGRRAAGGRAGGRWPAGGWRAGAGQHGTRPVQRVTRLLTAVGLGEGMP